MLSSTHKVLMVSARSDIGGGPAHMWALAQGLTDQVEIYASLPDDGVFFKQFSELIGIERVFKIPRQKLTLKALWDLRRFCKQNQIDLIHSHGKGAGLYSRLLSFLLSVPVIHTLHGYHDGRYAPWLKHLYALWETLAGLVTSKIICVSASEALLFKNKAFVSSDKLVVIPNGTAVQRDVLVTPIQNKVVTVARFDYQKNLVELLYVCKLLPKHDFFVIGDGADRVEIEAEVVAQKLCNVMLCGASQQVIEDIADAAVYLTTARWEGLPLAVLEAMSLGIPVVASDVVGNRDAVAEGVTGYLYPLGDVETAARLIDDAMRLDRTLIRKHHQKYFSADRMVSQTLVVYRDALSATP